MPQSRGIPPCTDASDRGAPLAPVAGLLAFVGSVTTGGPSASASAQFAVPATPILLSDDNASAPGVADASDGTSHVAWAEDDADGGGGRVVVYCRLPRGAVKVVGIDSKGRTGPVTSGKR